MRRSVHHRLTTLEMIVTAGAVAVVGALLIWLSTVGGIPKHETVKLLLNEFGVVLVAAVAVGLLWELIGKRAFASEIFEVARVGVDVRNASLVRISTSYLEDVEWDAYFAGVEKLDIFVAYAGTWRATHTQRLRAVAARPGTRIRVYLPNPHDQAVLVRLGRRFNLAPDELRTRIVQARTDFEALRRVGGGEVIVHYHDGDTVFSCYRFDGTAILTLYSHTRDRANVPTLVCRSGGTLYDFVRDELRAIEGQSRECDEVDAAYAEAEDSP
jgi:hypothetical protein